MTPANTTPLNIYADLYVIDPLMNVKPLIWLMPCRCSDDDDTSHTSDNSDDKNMML